MDVRSPIVRTAIGERRHPSERCLPDGEDISPDGKGTAMGKRAIDAEAWLCNRPTVMGGAIRHISAISD